MAKQAGAIRPSVIANPFEIVIFCPERQRRRRLVRSAAYRSSEDTINSGQTYKDAGVDIAAGDALVEAIKPLAASTRRPGADAALGGFGALFDLKAAGFRDPVLVASTDGVGTKLKIAIETGRHEAIGIDLVAMCVNDIVVQGAEPLFFLDYFATARLDPVLGAAVVAGIAEGCRQAGCALVGGESAEMPGLYATGDYDLAGFAVGAAEREHLITGANVVAGDVLLGLGSTGVHSNGFSLVRRIKAQTGLGWDAPAPFAPDVSLADAFLTPTRIYVRSCLAALAQVRLKALAHITGGGLSLNVPRVIPKGLVAEIDARRWPEPAVFAWLRREGHIAPAEMARTFNCGIGMVVAVAAEQAAAAAAAFTAADEPVFEIGRIRAGREAEAPAEAEILGMEEAWPASR